MRALALLLLLLAAASARADCPDGMSRATAQQRRALAAVGLAAANTHLAEVCDRMPELVTQPAVFDIEVKAVCASANSGAALFQVTFASPCRDGAKDSVYMTVDTAPKRCIKAYDPKLARWGWHTTTPGNMRPLQCPKGYRKATRKDVPLLDAFLMKQFVEVEMPHRLSGKYACHGGIAHMRWHYQNGCVQIWPKGVAPYVMAQGKVDYSCYGSDRVVKLGIDGEGQYKTFCQWAVSFKH